MNINLNETVTLSIKTYEDMKNEIKYFRQKAEEKTVIKVVAPVSMYVTMSLFIFLWVILLIFLR